MAFGCIYKSSPQHSLNFRKIMECCGELAHIHPISCEIRLKSRKSKQEAWSAPENLSIYTRAPANVRNAGRSAAKELAIYTRALQAGTSRADFTLDFPGSRVPNKYILSKPADNDRINVQDTVSQGEHILWKRK